MIFGDIALKLIKRSNKFKVNSALLIFLGSQTSMTMQKVWLKSSINNSMVWASFKLIMSNNYSMCWWAGFKLKKLESMTFWENYLIVRYILMKNYKIYNQHSVLSMLRKQELNTLDINRLFMHRKLDLVFYLELMELVFQLNQQKLLDQNQ